MRKCSVPGCVKPHDSHGYCGAHRERWKRYGDPLAGRTPEGEPERYLRDIVLAYDGDECLTWPYARNGDGRAKMSIDGKISLVHRHVCELVNGPPPTPRHQAAHSCGKGHEACVAKRHLSWKTQVENEIDKITHGTTNRGERCGTAKLTAKIVNEIVALKGRLPQPEIAARYGVSRTTISAILTGRTWSHLEVGK